MWSFSFWTAALATGSSVGWTRCLPSPEDDSPAHSEREQLMTPEQRLDRLERIAKLIVRDGLRTRREGRQPDEKINILIDAQIKNEEKFARN